MDRTVLTNSAMTRSTVVFLFVAATLIVSGCAGGAGGDRVCVARSRGTCLRYEDRHPTTSEAMSDDLGRQQAAVRGEAYTPTPYRGESPTKFLERSNEEHARYEAGKRGESYSAPQRSGESTSAWFKRRTKEWSASSPSSANGR